MIPSAEVVWREDVQLWWPVADGDPETAHRWVLNRLTDSDLTVALCKRRRVCVQAGGYVGHWPMRLAKSFDQVLTFEIMPGCYEACRRNCAALPNVTVAHLGLGAVHGITSDVSPRPTAGSWRLEMGGPLSVEMTTIDHLQLTNCDAIILDIEGSEVAALQGAAKTIARCRPVIHVEELPRARQAIQAHIKGLGYREVRRVHGDAIYVPR